MLFFNSLLISFSDFYFETDYFGELILFVHTL